MVRKIYEEDVEGSSDEDVDVFYLDINRGDFQDVGVIGIFEEDDYFDDFNDLLNKMLIIFKDFLFRKYDGKFRFFMKMFLKFRFLISLEFL